MQQRQRHRLQPIAAVRQPVQKAGRTDIAKLRQTGKARHRAQRQSATIGQTQPEQVRHRGNLARPHKSPMRARRAHKVDPSSNLAQDLVPMIKNIAMFANHTHSESQLKWSWKGLS